MNATPLLVLALAQFDAAPITVVKPGAGFLIADGVSEVPLEVVLNGGGEINSAKIKAEAGNVSRSTVITGNRVRFMYRVPKAATTVEEVLDIQLRLANGNTTSTIYTLVIAAPALEVVKLETAPKLFDASAPTDVALTATARGKDLETLEIHVDKGELVNVAVSGDGSHLEATASLRPPPFPPDAPSHLTLVAVASSKTGYGLGVGGVSVRAPVRLSVEIPPGSTFQVEGADNPIDPVVAPADGRTVVEGVLVRYGSRVKASVTQGGKKRPLSVVLPTGQVSPGVVAAIPDQAIADGGTGPSLVVAIPPAALGGKIFWPDITIEGAKLVKAIDAGEYAKVLVLQRPTESTQVTVLLDEVAAGTIDFSSPRGASIAIESVPTEQDERAAASITVKDARGQLTDLPVPRVRAPDGTKLTPQRIAPGRYRVSLAPGTKGKPGERVELIAELPPAPLIAGEALELVRASTEVLLEGLPPAIRAEDGAKIETERPKVVTGTSEEKFAIGVIAAGLVGASFARAVVLGGGVQLEVRLPFWQQRLGGRLGIEFVHQSGSGQALLGSNSVDVKTRIAGFLIPLEVVFAYVTTRLFEGTIRAGGDLRIETGAIEIDGNGAGGGTRVGGSARFGLDAVLKLDIGHFTLGATLIGLGASADGFSSPVAQLSGSLIGLRADLSYGFWF